MSARRLGSVLSVVLFASATAAVAQPKGGAPAPAKEPAPTGLEKEAAPTDPASGSGAGSAVEMTEDPPPEDMEGTNENPDAPRVIGEDPQSGIPSAPPVLKKSGYPVEEVLRPITLPQNMSEIGIEMHAAVSPYAGSSSLRARYGITRQVQLGLTYLMAGVFAEKDFVIGSSADTKVHPGKAVGLDVTILAQDWVGIRVGIPVYIDPVAVGLTLGAPLRFVFGDKVAIGGLEDLVAIRLSEFVPSFYQEAENVALARAAESKTAMSKGYLRFAGWGAYQHKPNLALIGRIGVTMDDFSSTKSDAGGGLTTFLRAGLQYTAKKRIDIGGSLGFDNLARGGSFSPQVYINVRI